MIFVFFFFRSKIISGVTFVDTLSLFSRYSITRDSSALRCKIDPSCVDIENGIEELAITSPVNSRPPDSVIRRRIDRDVLSVATHVIRLLWKLSRFQAPWPP